MVETITIMPNGDVNVCNFSHVVYVEKLLAWINKQRGEILMKILTAVELNEIRSWIYQNARPIDLSLWKYHFENGDQETVLSYLSFYQNEDGGFGHALEADNWNPHSSPYTTLTAINILKAINFEDREHPILKGIFRFFESGAYCTERGWHFSTPTNNNYPHAPWWTYNEESNEFEGIGITAEIVSFILKYAEEGSSIYKKAFMLVDVLIKILQSSSNFGDMGVSGYCILLDRIENEELTDNFDYKFMKDKVKGLVHDSIIRDTSKWVHYSVRPSEYIYSPKSIYYEHNKDIVDKELDYLIETRPKDGVWDITWSWFDNNEKYAKEFAISENWWKATKAIEKLRFLQAFDRLELNFGG